MRRGACIGRQEGHTARHIVLVSGASTPMQGQRGRVIEGLQGAVVVKNRHRASQTGVDAKVEHTRTPFFRCRMMPNQRHASLGLGANQDHAGGQGLCILVLVHSAEIV